MWTWWVLFWVPLRLVTATCCSSCSTFGLSQCSHQKRISVCQTLWGAWAFAFIRLYSSPWSCWIWTSLFSLLTWNLLFPCTIYLIVNSTTLSCSPRLAKVVVKDVLHCWTDFDVLIRFDHLKSFFLRVLDDTSLLVAPKSFLNLNTKDMTILKKLAVCELLWLVVSAMNLCAFSFLMSDCELLMVHLREKWKF